MSTPAAHDLFDEDQVTSMLTEEHGGQLSSVVMTMQWMAEQGRPDVQLLVSYLTSCLIIAMSQDWQKLL